jgi:hypothetical protein
MQQFMSHDGMDEEKKDIEKTLSRLPSSHRQLVQNYRWKFHPGNTLNGDDEHVGYIDDNDKEIAVAGPWNYGREFTILHEVGHKVWERLVPPEMKHRWHQIASKMTPAQKEDESLKQEPEEIFCMCYAQKYAQNKMEKFNNPLWQKFMEDLPE